MNLSPGSATTAPGVHPAPQASHSTRLCAFLAFKLGQEEYGMDILRVQEIRSYEKPTLLPHGPAHLLGVVNLRGTIVPLMDLRVRLQLAQATYDAHTVVIVVNVGQRVVGLVVDSVSDVLSLRPEQMRPVPALESGFAPEHLLALGCVDERTLLLLDIEQYLAASQGTAAPA
ncbi:MAG: chemotaxis protein CheW [Simplicispira sp.]|uniref:chemotaxis protein CheW n=1 Tax=Simplicispira sp. TaxID=2015802 RepID=UPI001B68D9EF|nr:chemotaxis protein CheW [Simplicispira sp.]MBP7414566.1 chemotaxis protein CheW [Giesbergeria sp.]MDD2691228.1 chemotaxis protein CheW [Simplicispira sp.]